MKDKYRVVILISGKGIISKNFNTKDKADDWVLNIMEKENVKMFRILDKEKNKIIETEKGEIK